MSGAEPSAARSAGTDPRADTWALRDYTLALADDALVAAQRLGEWIAAAPQIEEDVALGNIALDLLGQARSLLTYAGSLSDPVRTEDDLAYWRDEREFRNVHLVERPWSLVLGGPRDYGVCVARLLVLSTYLCELYEQLRSSTDETLAGVAAKAVKEVDYHRDHATMWTLRLGDGTEESHARMEAAFDAEWPYVAELFDDAYVDPRLVEQGVAVLPSTLRDGFDRRIADVLAEATLSLPEVSSAVGGGRRGVHTEEMGYLLAELQHLTRSHPGASW
jgi:ring-1,2-phenylacetyl-CoA epoxidase subunit PaaC